MVAAVTAASVSVPPAPSQVTSHKSSESQVTREANHEA